MLAVYMIWGVILLFLGCGVALASVDTTMYFQCADRLDVAAGSGVPAVEGRSISFWPGGFRSGDLGRLAATGWPSNAICGKKQQLRTGLADVVPAGSGVRAPRLRRSVGVRPAEGGPRIGPVRGPCGGPVMRSGFAVADRGGRHCSCPQCVHLLYQWSGVASAVAVNGSGGPVCRLPTLAFGYSYASSRCVQSCMARGIGLISGSPQMWLHFLAYRRCVVLEIVDSTRKSLCGH